jgi:4-amino-4-deoxy-L-arabinose transferase-like glycosyltransferase
MAMIFRVHEFVEHMMGRRNRRASLLSLTIALLAYLTLSITLLNVFPPPLPDEMFFAPAAHSLFLTGKLGTPVILGLEQHTFWQPPAYYVGLGLFFKIFGYNFESLRLFSILCGSAVVILTFVIGRQVKMKPSLLAICLLLVVVDPFFLRYSKIGRMDSFAMVWILFSLLAHIRWLQGQKRGWNVASVLSAALATASHPVGLVAPAGLFLHRFVLHVHKKIDRVSMWAPVISAFLVYLLLLPYWAQDLKEFLVQMQFQFSKKLELGIFNSMINWITQYRTLPALIALLSCALVYATRMSSRRGWAHPVGAVTTFGLLAVAVTVTNFGPFYPLYYIPLVALSVTEALGDMLETKPRFGRKTVALLILLGAMNAALFDSYFCYVYLFKVRDETSLPTVARQVSNLVPPHSNVLLLGSPNLFWELRLSRADLSFFDEIAIDSVRKEQLLQRVNVVVAMRAFQSSFDRYVEGQRQGVEEALLRRDKRLRLVGTVGIDRPYAYRGSVSVVEPSSR